MRFMVAVVGFMLLASQGHYIYAGACLAAYALATLLNFE